MYNVHKKHLLPPQKGTLMEEFDYRKLSRLTYPSGANETMYLRFSPDGRCEASDRERECVMHNFGAADCVGVLNAKLHPVNDADRTQMIAALEKCLVGYQRFITKYGTLKHMKGECGDYRKFVSRTEKEMQRLKELKLS